MKLSDLTPDPNNANRGTERGNSALEASLQQYGAGRSILLDKNDTIIAGNKTAEMAGQLGMMNVKVVETTGDELVAVKRTDLDLETDASAREMAYADNRVGELSLDWDADALLNDIENGIDVSKFFSDNEVDKLLGPKPTEDVPAPDATAELQEKWETERGQVWTIGRHRLMCGDCSTDMDTLMTNEKAAAIFTDPPYALFGNSTGVAGISDDKMVRPFFRDVGKVGKQYTEDFAHVYVCCDWHSAPCLYYALGEVGLTSKNLIIWDKGDGGLGAMYQQCYELIWMFANSPKPTTVGKVRTGERTVCGVPNIWRVGRVPHNERQHNATKPLALPQTAIKNSTDSDGVILDPFLGSGTTMVAAEQLDRTCYGMEIDPGYCAVILERMSGMGLEGTIAV